MKTYRTFIRESHEQEPSELLSEGSSKPKKKLHKAAATLGHYGGKKGGPARARKLSAKRRSDIASQGAKARWKGSPKKD